MNTRTPSTGHLAERLLPWSPPAARAKPRPALAALRRRSGAAEPAPVVPERATALLDAVRLRLAEAGAVPTTAEVAAALRAARPRWAVTTCWTPSAPCGPNSSVPDHWRPCSARQM